MGYYIKIASSLSIALFIYTGLTYMLTNYGFRFDVGGFILSISPYAWSSLGVAFSISLSVVGAAAGIFSTGTGII